MALEQEKAQKEADIKISNSEVLALQKEFDAISTTVNQLETQKCEAQKRLDELDDKVGLYELDDKMGLYELDYNVGLYELNDKVGLLTKFRICNYLCKCAAFLKKR